jgi:hypothetical protein
MLATYPGLINSNVRLVEDKLKCQGRDSAPLKTSRTYPGIVDARGAGLRLVEDKKGDEKRS